MSTLQELFVPEGTCFGCGPANERGLGLRSHAVDGVVVADWQPQPHHESMPGFLCGGVISTLIDCHSAAALAHAVKDAEGEWPWAQSPPWATAGLSVSFLRPTTLGSGVRLVADSVSLRGDEATVAVALLSDGKQRATGEARWRRLRSR